MSFFEFFVLFDDSVETAYVEIRMENLGHHDSIHFDFRLWGNCTPAGYSQFLAR